MKHAGRNEMPAVTAAADLLHEEKAHFTWAFDVSGERPSNRFLPWPGGRGCISPHLLGEWGSGYSAHLVTLLRMGIPQAQAT